MKIGIISFFDYDTYIKPKKKLKIYEGWNKAWEEAVYLGVVKSKSGSESQIEIS